MVPLISKIFCLTNCDDVRNAIQTFSKSIACDVIPNLKPDVLMEDEFVAGFCTKGEVTIIPLLPSPDFDFSVDKSVLTFRMSPTVYSGFGLACTKVKEKFKKFHYHFSQNLRSPKFKRNSCLHRRLRDFLRSSSLSSESLRVPRGTLQPRPCFVQWVPSFAQCTEQLPTPDSLARYLGDGTRCKLKSSLSITQWSNPLRLPDLFVQSETGHPTATNEQELRQSVDLNKVRAVFNILSCLVTGIASSPERDENAEYNPCMTEMRLAPSLALDWLAAVPPTWSFHNPVCVRLDGLFTVEQAARLENTVRDLVEHSHMERCFAFWIKRPLLLDSVNGTSCPESSSNVRLFLTTRQTTHPFTVLNLSVD